MRPSIRQLEYAVALADHLHFGRAARAAGVTQPALSSQIQALEELLGATLFERSRRKVIPTPLGRWVAARARAVLAGIDELCEVAGAGGEPLAAAIRLGVIPTIAPYLLPGWLPEARRAHPRLQLLLREDQTDPLVESLRDGHLDLLLLALPIERRDVQTLSIGREPFVLAAPRDHPLARGRGGVREEELAGADVLLLEDGHCLRDQALAVCSQAGATESAAMRATSLGTLVQMVAGGLGVTLLPASAVAVEARGLPGLRVRRFAPPEPCRELGLAWRRGSPRAEEFELLAESLRGALGDVPA